MWASGGRIPSSTFSSVRSAAAAALDVGVSSSLLLVLLLEEVEEADEESVGEDHRFG